jgi:hypothetical protein
MKRMISIIAILLIAVSAWAVQKGGDFGDQFGSAYYGHVTTVNAATYDLLATDFILNVTYTDTAAVTSLTLPTAQVIAGRLIHIKDSDMNANTNSITIDTEGGATIDESATLVMNVDGQSVSLFCDGVNWWIF